MAPQESNKDKYTQAPYRGRGFIGTVARKVPGYDYTKYNCLTKYKI